MKKFNAIWCILAIFGGITAYEVISRFGWNQVDLPQDEFFWFSIWDAFRNFVSFTAAFLAIPFLFGRHARWILIPAAIGMLLIEALILAGSVFHADVARVWLDLLRETNMDEATNFIGMFAFPSAVIFVIAFIAALIASVYFLWTSRYPKFSKRNLLIGLGLLVPFILFNCILTWWHNGVTRMNYFSFAIISAQAYMDQGGVRNACLRPNLPDKVATKVSSEQLPDVVFVIGESSTRNNWNLYGYPRSTTPRMNEICRCGGGVCFSDVITTQPDTINALNHFLTDVTFDNKADGNWTLAEVYRRAGYRCVLISQQFTNNPRTGLYQLFNGCEKRIDAKANAHGKRIFDDALIPMFEKELNADELRPSCVFVHLEGMHFPVQNAIPEGDKHFTNEIEPEVLSGLSDNDKDRRNRYDDAIRYEDKVLGMMVDSLSSRTRPCCMFYCSDHGESPRAAIWRDYADKDVYEIPAICWFSDSYRRAFPTIVTAYESAKDRKLQQDELTHGLLELGLIEFWNDAMQLKNFLNPNFKALYPRVMNKGRMKCERDM